MLCYDLYNQLLMMNVIAVRFDLFLFMIWLKEREKVYEYNIFDKLCKKPDPKIQ